MGWLRMLLRFFPLIYFWSSSRAALVNRTIDDSFGDLVTGFKPIYNPQDVHWEDQTCSTCDIQPNRSLAYDGTWTAATYNPQVQNMSITLQFTGVAIWVFFILSNANEHGTTITTNTNCNFTLDGSHAGVFVHNPNMSTFDLVYNATAFNAMGLNNTPHQLIIMTNDVPFNVFVNFDYAIYTTVIADPSNSTSNSSDVSHNNGNSSSTSHSVPTIVGAVLGALAVIAIASLLFLLLQTRKSKKRSDYTDEPITIPLLPTREGGHARFFSGTDNREKLRAIRQMEIDEQLRSAQRKMENLTARPPNAGERPTETNQEMEDLREEVRLLRDQIDRLQMERQSDWALGLSDEPPPAYAG